MNFCIKGSLCPAIIVKSRRLVLKMQIIILPLKGAFGFVANTISIGAIFLAQITCLPANWHEKRNSTKESL